MYGKDILRLAFWGWIFSGLMVSAAQAAPPWVNLVSFNSVEADPEKDYILTENHGPYLIVACSFSGEGAEKQAQELVLELRKRYKLSAYLYKKTFELDKAQGRGLDGFGEPVQMKYRAGEKIKEVAVMVGEFSSVDDSAAQSTLKKIKYAKPKCLEQSDDETTQSLAGWREFRQNFYESIGSKKKDKGPMNHAMIAPNPLLPPGFFVQKGLDPFLVNLNKDLEYTLLNCPGKYTVQVATFKGNVVIKQDKIKEIMDGREKFKGGLVEAANKATLLTQALRMKGYEAYEFHDRNASIVTVGSFNSVGTPLSDGRIELDPRILAIMKTFGAKGVDAQIGSENTLNSAVKSLAGINFDVQPIPVQVPKVSISQSMRRDNEVERIDFRE